MAARDENQDARLYVSALTWFSQSPALSRMLRREKFANTLFKLLQIGNHGYLTRLPPQAVRDRCKTCLLSEKEV